MDAAKYDLADHLPYSHVLIPRLSVNEKVDDLPERIGAQLMGIDDRHISVRRG